MKVSLSSRLRVLLALPALLVGGCISTAGIDGDFADLRGTWDYTGDQSAPALDLTGTLVVEAQDGDLITGRLTWEESDGMGGIRVEAALVSGRVLESADVDFDVRATGGDRRHVAHLENGTIAGAWVVAGAGIAGSFSAVRRVP